MKNLFATLAALALIAPSKGTAAEAFSDPNMFLQTSVSIGGTHVDVGSNRSESKISSESQAGFGVRALVQYWYNPYFTFTTGMGLEQASYLIKHDVAGMSAEFEGSALLLGLPLGAEINLFRVKNLYFPVLFVPKLKLSESTQIKRCPGLCRADNSMNSLLLFHEIGVGWIQGNWDFQLLWVQALSKQFDNDVSDLRLKGMKVLVGYVW